MIMVRKHKKKRSKKRGYYMRSGLRKRGAGNRGGVGRSGVGKRGKQKKHKFMKDGELGYGKSKGFKSIHEPVSIINVGMLSEQVGKLGEKKKGKYYVDLKNEKKVLGKGVVNVPIIIKNFIDITDSAKKKIEKAGGEVVTK